MNKTYSRARYYYCLMTIACILNGCVSAGSPKGPDPLEGRVATLEQRVHDLNTTAEQLRNDLDASRTREGSLDQAIAGLAGRIVTLEGRTVPKVRAGHLNVSSGNRALQVSMSGAQVALIHYDNGQVGQTITVGLNENYGQGGCVVWIQNDGLATVGPCTLSYVVVGQ